MHLQYTKEVMVVNSMTLFTSKTYYCYVKHYYYVDIYNIVVSTCTCRLDYECINNNTTDNYKELYLHYHAMMDLPVLAPFCCTTYHAASESNDELMIRYS